MRFGIIPPRRDKARATSTKAPGTVIGRTSLLVRLVILVVISTVPALLVLTYLEHDLWAEGRERIGAEASTGRAAERQRGRRRPPAESGNQPTSPRYVAAIPPAAIAWRNSAQTCQAMPRFRLLRLTGRSSAPPRQWLVRFRRCRNPYPYRCDHRSRGLRGRYVSPPAGDRGAMLSFCLPFTMESGGRAVVIVGLSLDWLGAHIARLIRPADGLMLDSTSPAPGLPSQVFCRSRATSCRQSQGPVPTAGRAVAAGLTPRRRLRS